MSLPNLTPTRRIGNPICDDHMVQSQRSFVYEDRHPADVACDMPGTGWEIGEPSRCVLPPDETDRAYLAAKEQPAA